MNLYQQYLLLNFYHTGEALFCAAGTLLTGVAMQKFCVQVAPCHSLHHACCLGMNDLSISAKWRQHKGQG